MVASWLLLRRERLYSERFADATPYTAFAALCRHIPDRYEKILTPIRRRAP
jgi:hypothetical protein